MPRALKIRHDHRPAVNAYASFMAAAPQALSVNVLVAAFTKAIAAERCVYHACCAVAPSGELLPLFGNNLALGDGARWLNGGLVPPPQPNPTLPELYALEAFPVELSDGEARVVLIGGPVASIERERRSRLNALATVFAGRGALLMEAEDAGAASNEPSAIERECLGMLLAGWSFLDIGEHFDRSAPAIGIHLQRAAAKLGVDSPTEAVAAASRRGMITLPKEVTRPLFSD